MISDNTVGSAKVYSAAVTGTKVGVTTKDEVLIFSISIFSDTGAGYLQFFDAQAADVTVGTTTPTFVLYIAAGGDKAQHFEFSKPIKFSTGLTIAATTTRTGNSTATVETLITYADA